LHDAFQHVLEAGIWHISHKELGRRLTCDRNGDRKGTRT